MTVAVEDRETFPLALSTTAPEVVSIQQLPQRLAEEKGFASALTALEKQGAATFDGVWGSTCALLAAELARRAPSSLLVVAAGENSLDAFCDDFELFAGSRPVEFPAYERAGGDQLLSDENFGQRLRVANQLLDGPPAKVIASTIHSLLLPTPSPQQLASNRRRLRVGEQVNLPELLEWLIAQGFQSVTGVELPGEVSHRGGIVDLFTPDWQDPVRMELFDDEVESLRRFDIATQKSLEPLSQVEIALPTTGRAEDHLASFLPADAWVLLIEPHEIQQEGKALLQRTTDASDCHSVAQVMKRLAKFSLACAASLAAGDLGISGSTCRLSFESVEQFQGDFEKIRETLDELAKSESGGRRIHIVLPTDADAERTCELLAPTQVARRGDLSFHTGVLHQGFRWLRQNTVVLSGRELFRRSEIRHVAPRRHGKAIDSFLDLREGDLVVHLSHGVGRYRGLKQLNKNEQVEEHLIIEFRDDVKIYVPASKIDLVQKYVGATKSKPTLAKVGGVSWTRRKQAAEQAVADMASDMLELQAQRRGRSGIAFGADTNWQREFDASFPYTETPDQMDAIAAIKQDMEKPRPMDRLLCGDVGFGKTEVAMRCAFKAVENGYQVALLAPTTVLAEQHYRTFVERMAEFPLDIARLSRFCTKRQQREIVAGLSSGQVDIVIGTHRLTSSDVKFHNLGLVIIDEEQRFGVEVKERLKTLQANVDVLTMTATPIPRTLHMSLVGIRDISNLESPPENRLAVQTRVTRFDPELVRDAVMREINRGGQIYFVHNRINDIGLLANMLNQAAPEARVRIGHGQMPEGALEKVMVDFVDHQFDVLLATTIVESGLDIPNANTIFINEADRYGLADLHQLRGRVGRSKHRAYAYLLVDSDKHLAPDAARRLRAIEEFSQIGAGFGIAMRDLEIRGAGNLLGMQQSGHISAVGYELYCDLLETAVRKLKSMPPKLSIDVDLDLPGEAWLPSDYVPDMRAKIDLYRRLTRIGGDEELVEFRGELIDRFGPLPPPVERMLELASLRLDAALWRISAIHIEDQYLVMRYAERSRIEKLAKLNPGRVRVVDGKSVYVPLDGETPSPDKFIALLKSLLRAR